MSRPTDFLSFTTAAPLSASASRSPLPPPRTAVLLTDTLEAPAQFALLQLIQRALRPQAHGGAGGMGASKAGGRRVVLVGVREREEYWAALLRKTGIQLPTETSAGHFSFIDASSPFLPLSVLYTSICEALSASPATADEGPLLIIDDLSALSWQGAGVREAVKWWKAVRAAVDATHASLITLLHADSLSPSHPPSPTSTTVPSHPFEDAEDQYLFRQVLQRSDVWVEVAGLLTGGGAGGTRGEITVHRAPSLVEDGFTLDPAPPLQYKLEDSSAVYEVKGVGIFL
ncbi:hypothetical protein JCM10213_007346 [Rhodosporidiobolus nylandii]